MPRRPIACALTALLLASPLALAQDKEPAGPLGVRVTPGQAVPKILEVIKGTTSAKLGILKDDVIVSVDGKPTPTVEDLVKVYRGTPRFAGDPIKISVRRGDKTLEFSGKLLGKPTMVGQKAIPWSPTRWGNLAEGQAPPTLESLKGKVVVLFCYQSW